MFSNVEPIEELKYLGLTMRQDQRWKSNDKKVCTKANKTPNFICLNISFTSVRHTQKHTY